MPAQAARKPKNGAADNMAANGAANDSAYDAVPYESFSYAQTHPRHVAAIGRLFGLTPPDFTRARVLELGCASGGNLLPVAMDYPDGEYTGLDLSGEQIAEAERHRAALGLNNIVFRQQDIGTLEIDSLKGAFDYIICHGVFSWVPAEIRSRILEICSKCLSPQGLAVVSYNTLPGWNAVRSIRDMMLFHTRRFSKPRDKIVQARALLEFLLENVPESRAGYRATIQDELNLLRKTNDSYLFHDHLEATNSQFYFNEFAALANENGLSYVGDSALSSMYIGNLSGKTVEKLRSLNDIVQQEQYMDFIVNRRFRTSILCHKGQAIRRALKPESVMDFHLSTAMKPEGVKPDPKKPITFKTPGGHFTTRSDIAGRLYLALSEAGLKPVSARDLIAGVQKKMKLESPDPVRETFLQSGLQLALRGHIQLNCDSPAFTDRVGKKPVAYPLARYQAGLGNCSSVTNALHGMVGVDLLSSLCLRLCDGTHGIEDMTKTLAAKAVAGEILISRDNVRLTVQAEIEKELKPKIEAILDKFREQALLVA